MEIQPFNHKLENITPMQYTLLERLIEFYQLVYCNVKHFGENFIFVNSVKSMFAILKTSD